MAVGTNPEELLKRLNDLHKAYIETFIKTHEALSLQIAGTTPASPAAPSKRRRRSTMDPDTESERPVFQHTASTSRAVFATNESSFSYDLSDDDDELYVQDPLSAYKFDTEDLRDHLKHYKFNDEGRKLLESVINKNGRLLNPSSLFPQYPPEDLSHNSHYTVFDVGKDGAPVSRRKVVESGSTIDSAIWQAIRDLNANPTSLIPKVGRITIIREPAPIIFGALHLTMNKHFDMDEIFSHLVSADASSAHIADRAFSDDARRQRSFVFNFDYYTVIGEDCAPMPWQLTDTIPKKTGEHIPISRCSSVVALSLSGECVKELDYTHRRAKTQRGYIYDPWAPWHVLNIQCYPDHKHSMDSHDSTKHYVNGPEAFLTTLLAEFKDAQKRFEEINSRISKLVTPSAQFMFSRALRDKLLFEDDEFTYSRRYFWAYQTLGTMKNALKAIIDGYEDTFTEEVWEGKHKSLWPMMDATSSRNIYWRKRMHSLKKDFEKEIKGLEKLYEEIDDLRKEIRTLRDQLFSGTSVLESRKSVELSTVTILQGHNIKLLTLVSIFFLPLTFVTSVFGMTNMPQEHNFRDFAIVMSVVCIPFFFLIGSLNTTSGMEFWRNKWHSIFDWVTRKSAFQVTKDGHPGDKLEETPRPRERSYSTSRSIAARKDQLRQVTAVPKSPHLRGSRRAASSSSRNTPVDLGSVNAIADFDGDSGRGKALETTASEKAESPKRNERTWREKLFGRKRKEDDHDV